MDIFGEYTGIILTVVILLLAALVAWAVIRALGARVKGRRGQRLAISEYHEVDKTRRLVLVRRDNTEHLLLIGGEQDLVVESGIDAPLIPAAHRPQPQAEPEAHEEQDIRPPMRPAPRPPVFGDRGPPLRAVQRDEPRLRPVGPFDDGR